MSVAATFRSLLLAHAPLAALVGTRVAQNAVPQGAALPYVAFNAQHTPEFGLSNTVLAEAVLFSVECWAERGPQADAVADAVAAAVQADQRVVTSRATTYDPEVDLHATVLTVEWWLP